MSEDYQEHAPLAPSGGGRWGLCAVSPRRCKGLPNTDTEESKRGTAAHVVLERTVNGGQYSTFVPNVELLDETDYEAVNVTYEYLKGQQGKLRIYAESRVDIGGQFGRDDCWGTMDIKMFKGHEIELVDYKNGMEVVEVFENKQLLLYALGVAAEFTHPFPDDYPIRLTIAQPRAEVRGAHPDGPIRSWVVTYGELMNKWAPYFKERMEATDDPNAPANPSSEACRWCLAKSVPGRCPELENKSLAAAQAIFAPMVTTDLRASLQDNVSRQVSDLSMDQIAYVLAHEKMIRGWLDAVKAYAQEQAVSGVVIPGQKVVAGPGGRKWKDESTVTTELCKLTKKDGTPIARSDVTEESILSFPKTEKKLKPLVTKETWTQITALMNPVKGKPTMAPLSDPREAIATNAAEVFKGLTGTSEPLPSFLL